MTKKKDKIEDEEIIKEIIEEAQRGRLFKITDDDIINMILIDFYGGEPLQQIAWNWDLTEEDVIEIVRSYPVSQEELEELRRQYLEEYDDAEEDTYPTNLNKYKH